MAEHWSAEAVERFRRGQVSAEEALSIGEHLRSCRECVPEVPERELRPLVQFLAEEPLDPLHLTYEQLAAFVDGTADAIDREIVGSHAAECDDCRRELRDLQSFARSVAARVPARRQTWYAVAAAALIALIGGAFFIQQHRPVVALRDGGREIGVLRDGRLTGLEHLSGDERRDVASALTNSELRMPPSLQQLRSHQPQQLLGKPSAETPLAPLAPLRSVIISDHPSFEWTPVAGAKYKVEVFDEHYRPVAESALLGDARWTATAALPRGGVYSWQVTATSGEKSFTAPAPPAAEARFEVLDAAHVEQIRRLQREQPPSHLALGLAYARAGAVAEAQQELQALVAENRDSVAAQRLLQSVQAWSR